MIPSRKNPLFTALFSRHVQGRLRRTFETVWIAGGDHLGTALARSPVLAVSNHTSWWDPLVAIQLARTYRADGYALMEARNLRRLPFFAMVGGFGVDLERPEDGAAAVRYAARLLGRPGRLVWIFAQGRERPITERPLGFHAGSVVVARVARASVVVPVALRYEHGSTERPELFISIGPPLSNASRDAQEAAVGRELDRVETALCAGNRDAFAPLLRAPRGRMAALAERALAWATRPSAGALGR